MKKKTKEDGATTLELVKSLREKGFEIDSINKKSIEVSCINSGLSILAYVNKQLSVNDKILAVCSGLIN